MRTMRGTVCELCGEPITPEQLRAGAALRYVRHGHVPWVFCWTGCARLFLMRRPWLDARTREAVETIVREVDATGTLREHAQIKAWQAMTSEERRALQCRQTRDVCDRVSNIQRGGRAGPTIGGAW